MFSPVVSVGSKLGVVIAVHRKKLKIDRFQIFLIRINKSTMKLEIVHADQPKKRPHSNSCKCNFPSQLLSTKIRKIHRFKVFILHRTSNSSSTQLFKSPFYRQSSVCLEFLNLWFSHEVEIFPMQSFSSVQHVQTEKVAGIVVRKNYRNNGGK